MRAFLKSGSPDRAGSLSVTAARAAALVVGCLAVFAAGGQAAPSFQEAVNDYNAGKYAHALSTLQAVNAYSPNNPYVHYYMALSHQAVGHIEQAKAEYQWVVSSRDPRLGPQAATGLSQLSGVRTTGSGGGSSSSASSTSTSASSGGTKLAQGKVKKVLDFWRET